MRNASSLAALVVLVVLASPAPASDPIGVYGIVDKVVVEPRTGPVERVQVWGVFALAKNEPRNAYEEPARGYLYFTLPADKEEEDAARREWDDLGKLAGTGECVGFGSRRGSELNLRKAAEKPARPDSYSLGFGLQRLPEDRDYGPVRKVRALPAPKSPADGGAAAPGPTELLAGNAASKAKDVQYFFELASRGGDGERSRAIAPGKSHTAWKPSMTLKDGETYTWRVWIKEGDWTGPVASAEFTVKAQPAPTRA